MSTQFDLDRAPDRSPRIVLFALAAIGYAIAAPAQTTGETAGQLEEIVVTAQFREQKLQDTPLAITAISAAMLEERGQDNIVEIAAQAPNVTLRETPAPTVPRCPPTSAASASATRHWRWSRASASTSTTSTFDAAWLDDGAMDLDRVEILRGPQGTLAGQNSIGGAIKLYSKKPGDTQDGYVQATYGSFTASTCARPAISRWSRSRLYARLSGTSEQKDGFITRYDYACTHPGTTVPTFLVNSQILRAGHGGRQELRRRSLGAAVAGH